MRNFFCSIFFLCFFVNVQFVFSQTKLDWIDYTWGGHFTQFKVPNTFIIRKAEGDVFDAVSADQRITFTIYPRKNLVDFKEKYADDTKPEADNASLSGELLQTTSTDIASKEQMLYFGELSELILSWANESQMRYNSEVQFLPDLNGYWGGLLDGYKNGVPVTILLVRDPDFPEQLLYIWVSYLETEREIVKKILRSFKPF
jgi:hypothetical protein